MAANVEQDQLSAEMLELGDNGQQSIGHVTWNEHDGVQYSANFPAALRDMLEDEGIYINGEYYTPANGRIFVENLPVAFSGSALRARLVKA